MSRPNPADRIKIVWHIDDVAELRPDLTRTQCRKVLARAHDQHDASVGISWDVLGSHADDLYPMA